MADILASELVLLRVVGLGFGVSLRGVRSLSMWAC